MQEKGEAPLVGFLEADTLEGAARNSEILHATYPPLCPTNIGLPNVGVAWHKPGTCGGLHEFPSTVATGAKGLLLIPRVSWQGPGPIGLIEVGPTAGSGKTAANPGYAPMVLLNDRPSPFLPYLAAGLVDLERRQTLHCDTFEPKQPWLAFDLPDLRGLLAQLLDAACSELHQLRPDLQYQQGILAEQLVLRIAGESHAGN